MPVGMQTSGKQESGFTLFELIIAGLMAIVIAVLAIPAYQNHVLRSNRTLAKGMLADLALRQETHALHHHAYATELGVLLGSYNANTNSFFLSREGRIAKTLNDNERSIYKFELLDATATSFELHAAAIDMQLNDVNCQSLTLNSRGQHSAVAKKGGNAADCWR